MKKMIVIAIASLLSMVTGFAQQPTLTQPKSLAEVNRQIMTDAPMPTMPSPSWQLVRSYFGPTIPAGWTIANIESVIYQGNSLNEFVVYLYNPSTRQTA